MPVYLRCTVNVIPKEITTKLYCDPDRWNKHAQRAKGTNETSKTLNTFLDTLERKVHQTRKKLLEANSGITAEAIKKMLTGQEEKPRTLLDVFKQHNFQMEKLKNIEYAPGTVRRFGITYQHAQSFIKWKYNSPDIEIKNLSYDFVSSLEFWL